MKIARLPLILTGCLLFSLAQPVRAAVPDSVSLFAYADGDKGLYLAWSTDDRHWTAMNHRFLSCDYGPWGSEKRMNHPFLLRGHDGRWHCLWSLNNRDPLLAHAASPDLINWKRQSYPGVMQASSEAIGHAVGLPQTGAFSNCLMPVCRYLDDEQAYELVWFSTAGADTAYFKCRTADFKTYGETVSCRRSDWEGAICRIEGLGQGTVHRIPTETLQRLTDYIHGEAYRNALHNERCADDPVRFAHLQPLQGELRMDFRQEKAISDHLMGIFFEDISHAADGGLYAELVQNRSFEYQVADTKGRNKNWNARYAWQGNFSIGSEQPLAPTNPHYAVLDAAGASLTNSGYDGMVLTAGDRYDCSFFARLEQGGRARMEVRLTDENGHALASGRFIVKGSSWKKYACTLTPSSAAEKGQLSLTCLSLEDGAASVSADMISLFPQKTFKNRPNGMRPDLAQVIADLHPRFVRFPGGCVAHGDGLDNMYRWKNTIGPLERRQAQRNIWNYHQSYGLGYYEYFCFCEDIGAEPLPVLPAGVPCQNSAHGGQQGGIPMSEMDDYVQEVLDLIEWANGDARTPWGSLRAAAGHPKPFHLKYIGIGNEDLITDVFEERFTMIFNAVKAKYPDIKVVGTVGPFYRGSDYEEGWDLAGRLGVDIVDEHYYNSPGWFIYNQNFYDAYDRNAKTKVYLGEYASHVPGKANNIESALTEALYLTAVERNGDVVEMCSYAPLLAKEGHTNWNPDLIYFNNTEVKPTVGYYVQQLFGVHSGDRYLTSRLNVHLSDAKARARLGASVVRDSRSSDLIVKLVNLLPVAATLTLQADGLAAYGPTAQKITLSGQPDDRTARPTESDIEIGNGSVLELPPYSFTVIRLHEK